MRLYKIAWAFWIAGTIVIALSWVHAVAPQVGWIGWGVALFGTLLSFFQRRSLPTTVERPSTVIADLDKLVLLRDRGEITEEQYLRQRNALLGEPGDRKP